MMVFAYIRKRSKVFVFEYDDCYKIISTIIGRNPYKIITSYEYSADYPKGFDWHFDALIDHGEYEKDGLIIPIKTENI